MKVQVELGYFELRVTITREANYPEQQKGIASIDPGVIHFAAAHPVTLGSRDNPYAAKQEYFY